MFGLGGTELILVFLVVLLLFGAKRIPEIAKSLGIASKEFKKAKNKLSDSTDELIADDESDEEPEEGHESEEEDEEKEDKTSKKS